MFFRNLVVVAIAITLIACSKAEDETQSTSKKVHVTGVIESVSDRQATVNGTEVDISNATITVEGQVASSDDLAPGMVVDASVTVDANGQASANSVVFEDEIEGEITSITIDTNGNGELAILGHTVLVNIDTVFESKVAGISTIADLASLNVVEVSGFVDANNRIVATRVELKAETRAVVDAANAVLQTVEVKGTVSNLATDASSFMLGNLLVVVDANTVVKDGVLSEGAMVEVHSTSAVDVSNGISIIASQVEIEGQLNTSDDSQDVNDSDHDINEQSLKGIVTNVDGLANNQFMLGDTLVSFDPLTTKFEHGISSDLLLNVMVKVEGQLDANGVLVVHEIEFADHDDELDDNVNEFEFKAYLTANAATDSVSVFGITVMLNEFTQLSSEDSMGQDMVISSLDLLAGGYVKIEAQFDATTGVLIAEEVELKILSANTTPVEKIEGVASVNNNILSIAGIAVTLPAGYAGTVASGDKLEIKGMFDLTTNQFLAESIEIDSEDVEHNNAVDTNVEMGSNESNNI
ncbi:MAG: DUF5666 domain-containing protein [Gammaproteobacteria bacterium]|nr:DUF5666 domain-containing protein [Gammaproteobacteria bacterium]